MCTRLHARAPAADSRPLPSRSTCIGAVSADSMPCMTPSVCVYTDARAAECVDAHESVRARGEGL